MQACTYQGDMQYSVTLNIYDSSSPHRVVYKNNAIAIGRQLHSVNLAWGQGYMHYTCMQSCHSLHE